MSFFLCNFASVKYTRMKQETKIIKVHFHRLHKGIHDYYYTNISAIYKQLSAKDLGICRQALHNARLYEKGFYANPFCTIELITLNENTTCQN